MALRLDEVLVRGEIDNTVEGRTTGWLWLLGRAEPVTLELEGDCWRDLAGCRLKFRNREPRMGELPPLDSIQKGLVGDMTVSKKARVPVCPVEEFVARRAAGEQVETVWKNSIYLEWFGHENGRVVIESCDFEMELSDPSWSMDGDAEEAQKLANLQAMRDFLEGMIARRPKQGEKAKDDEFEWEQRLKESDRLTDAYQEVLEKYMDDPDAEQKEAFVMGWDGLLDAMATEDEEEDVPEWKKEVFEAQNEDSWEDDEGLFKEHPLQMEAHDLALRAFDLLRDQREESEDGAELVSMLMQVAAKLAGALAGTYEREAGYVLAILKRCLNWQNEALAACARLIASERDNDQQRALEALRDDIFQVRQQLTELRRELKGS